MPKKQATSHYEVEQVVSVRKLFVCEATSEEDAIKSVSEWRDSIHLRSCDEEVGEATYTVRPLTDRDITDPVIGKALRFLPKKDLTVGGERAIIEDDPDITRPQKRRAPKARKAAPDDAGKSASGNSPDLPSATAKPHTKRKKRAKKKA